MSSTPTSPSLTSVATSFPSPAGAPVLSGPSDPNSSHFDIPSGDQYTPRTPLSTSSKHRFFPIPFSSAKGSASTAPMGQGQSRTGPAAQPPLPSVAAASPAFPLSSSSNPIKRAWGRRKKSEDVTAVFAGALNSNDKSRSHETETIRSVISNALATPATSVDNLQVRKYLESFLSRAHATLSTGDDVCDFVRTVNRSAGLEV